MLPTRCPSTLTMEARRAAEGLLGVSHLCTKKEIAKAYRKKALLAHPDKGGSEAHFTALTDAYALLVAARDDAAASREEAEEAPDALLRYRVSGKNGALVRAGVALDTAVVGTLARGSLATVFAADGRAATATAPGGKVRVRLAFPLAGWVTATAVQEEGDFLRNEPATLKAAIRRAGRGAPRQFDSFKSYVAAGRPAAPQPPPPAEAPRAAAVERRGDGSFSSFVAARQSGKGAAPAPSAGSRAAPAPSWGSASSSPSWGSASSSGSPAAAAASEVRRIADGVSYHPDVLAGAAAAALFAELDAGVPWAVHADDFGAQGRPTYYCGDDDCVFSFVGCRHEPRPWPPALDALRPSLEAALALPPRSLTACLLNRYAAGAGHIPFHSDEVRAHGFKRVVASLSLGGPRTFRLRRKATGDDVADLALASGSALVMTGDAQDDYEHELPLRGGDAARISCTFRSIVPGFERAWEHIHDN